MRAIAALGTGLFINLIGPVVTGITLGLAVKVFIKLNHLPNEWMASFVNFVVKPENVPWIEGIPAALYSFGAGWLVVVIARRHAYVLAALLEAILIFGAYAGDWQMYVVWRQPVLAAAMIAATLFGTFTGLRLQRRHKTDVPPRIIVE